MKSFLLRLAVMVAAATTTRMVTAIPEQECIDSYLPDRLACYETDGPCDSLPIPDGSFPQITPNDRGYAIDIIRSTPTTRVYYVTEFSYIFMVVLDIPVEGEGGDTKRSLADTKKMGKKKMKGGKKSGGSNKGGSKKSIKGGSSKKVTVAIIDFPDGNFPIRDETGTIIGSLVTHAIDEIVFDIESFTIEDIGDVQMVLSHAHFDHIGAATITHDHIESSWGIPVSKVIAAASVEEGFHRLIDLGLFSYRSPMPNVHIHEKTSVKIGESTEIYLEPVAGHSIELKDLIVFIEADAVNPPIMMFVDIVFPKWAPFFKFAITTDLAEYLAVHDTLLAHPLGDDGIFIGGHLNQIGSKLDIEISKAYTEAVMDAALSALQTVDIGPIAGASGVFDPSNTANYGNNWLLFDEYFAEVKKVCAKEVVAKYGCRLAAVDTTILSACDVAQSFWRIEA